MRLTESERFVRTLPELYERYKGYCNGPISVPLSEYCDICFSLGAAMTEGPYIGKHGGFMFLGHEFLPAPRSPRMQLKLTEHCRQRAQEMGIKTRNIKNILNNCEIDAPSGRGDGYRIAVWENIAVPYTTDGRAVTVLWRGEESRDAVPRQSV